MNKTPVSILQEMMVKKCVTPNYELIHDGGGTHANTFTFQVSCDGLTARGTGRCKKDAKHEAAKNMLEAIALHRNYPQLPASPAQSPVRTPLPEAPPASPKIPPNQPFVNAVGALQDLCAENELQDPEYTAVSHVGPPHAPVFTMRCTVSTFNEEGEASTKKQAKHDAAKKMLDRLMDVLSDCRNNFASLKLERNSQHERANEIAKKCYVEITKVPAVAMKRLGVRMSELHLNFCNSYGEEVRKEMISKLNALEDEAIRVKNTQEPQRLTAFCKTFYDYLKEIGLDVVVTPYPTKKTNGFMMLLCINSTPEIVVMKLAESPLYAEFTAAAAAIRDMVILLRSKGCETKNRT